MRAKTIVILRPAEDSTELSDAVMALGFEPLIEPIISISYHDISYPLADPGAPLIFTSAHGVRAFAGRNEGRSHSVYAVGIQTAAEAGHAGFTDIHTASGNVDALAIMLEKELKNSLKTPLYIRADDVSKDLHLILAGKGIKIEEIIAYAAKPTENLSNPLLKRLEEGHVNAIMFFSARGADIFADLLRRGNRLEQMRPIRALCLSDGVVKSVSVLPFAKTVVADTPDRYGMIDLVKRLF